MSTMTHDAARWYIHLWAKGQSDPVLDPKPYTSREEASAELVRTLRWDAEHARSEAFPFAGNWVGGTVFPAGAEARCDSCGKSRPVRDLAPCPCGGCKGIDCLGGCSRFADAELALADMRGERRHQKEGAKR